MRFVRPCVPCVPCVSRVRPGSPRCVSRLPPVSFYPFTGRLAPKTFFAKLEGFCEIQIQAWTVNLGPWTTFRRPRPRLTLDRGPRLRRACRRLKSTRLLCRASSSAGPTHDASRTNRATTRRPTYSWHTDARLLFIKEEQGLRLQTVPRAEGEEQGVVGAVEAKRQKLLTMYLPLL